MNTRSAAFFFFASSYMATLAGLPAASGQVELPGFTSTPTLAPLMQRISPAVVNIAAESTVTVQRNPLFDDPFFRRFFGEPEQRTPNQVPRRSVGSGVIVDATNGYILTNHHVIDNATGISVTLSDRRRLAARLVGSDARTDQLTRALQNTGTTFALDILRGTARIYLILQ